MSLRYKLSNLVTLCRKHHQGFHSWNGGTQKTCTEVDLELYLFQLSRYGRAFIRLRLSHVLYLVTMGVLVLYTVAAP